MLSCVETRTPGETDVLLHDLFGSGCGRFLRDLSSDVGEGEKEGWVTQLRAHGHSFYPGSIHREMDRYVLHV